MKKSLLITFFAAVFVTVSASAAEALSYRTFQPGDNMPTAITGIYVQPRGYVWLSSDEGAVKMDNDSFHLYRASSADGCSLPSDKVLQVVMDEKSNTWVLTDAGLAEYVPASDDFKNFDFIATAALPMPEGCYFCVGQNVVRYDYESGEFVELKPFSKDSRHTVSAMYKWTNGRILLFSVSSGVLIYDPESQSAVNAPVSFIGARAFIVDSRLRIWCAEKEGGFAQYDSNFERLNFYDTHNSGLVNDAVHCFAEAGNCIYIGTGDGISVFYPDSRIFESYRNESGKRNSFPATAILSIADAGSGSILVGRRRGGLISAFRASAESYNISEDGPCFLSPDGVNDLLQTPGSDLIWCATDGQGIASYNPSTSSFTKYPQTSGKKPVSLALLADGKLLFYNYHDGFYSFDRNSGSVQPYTFGNPALDKDASASIHEVISGPGDVIYISVGNEIYSYDSRSKAVNSVRVPAELAGHRIHGAKCLSAGKFFFSERYVLRYDASSNSLVIVGDIGDDGRVINSVAEGAAEILWVATSKGLASLDGRGGELTLVENEFVSNVYGVLCDKRGKVWLSVPETIYSYDPVSGDFYRLGYHDGLGRTYGFHPKPNLVSAANDVYLAGTSCFVRIFNDFKTVDPGKPEIVVERVTVDSESVKDPLKVKAKTGAKKIQFRFFVYQDIMRTQKQYRFMTRQRGNETVYLSDTPELELVNIHPGKYELYASCTGRNCTWSDWTKVSDINVTAPWYESWWFYIISLLIGAALILGVFYYMKHGYKERHTAKAAAADPGDQKSENDTLSELRTPLTLILGPLEGMVDKLPEDDPNTKRIRGIYKQALRMRGILDSKNGLATEAPVKGDNSGVKTPDNSKNYNKGFVSAALDPVKEADKTVPVIDRSMLNNDSQKSANEPAPRPVPETRSTVENVIRPAVDTVVTRPVVVTEPESSQSDPISIVRAHMSQPETVESVDQSQDDFSSIVDLKDASILIVEDDIELRSYIREELLDDAKKVFVAGNGVEAIERLNRENIDIIVSDVMMPEMDGFALCRYVKTTVAISHIPVILLTARTDENSRLLGYKNGADDYITKPFDINFLKKAICNLFLSRAIIRQRYQQSGAPDSRETTFSSADENFMVAFEKLVRDNISNPNLDIRMLVEGMNMSRTVLFNKVKQLTGMNIQNYVNKCRMEHVIEMMKTSSLPLAEIAEQSGFNSPRYFSTSFKNYTGMTPSQYKKEVIDAGKK